MSLDWNVSEVKNWEEVIRVPMNPDWTPEEVRSVQDNHDTWVDDSGNPTHYMSPITSALIWGSLLHGFKKITKDNYHEVWMRLAMEDAVQRQGRIFTRSEDRPRYRSINLEEVYAHIGLTTNVSPVTKTEFYNRLLKRAEERKRLLEMGEERKAEVVAA